MKILHSFQYALKGIRHGLKGINMQVHVGAMVLVLILGVVLKISGSEWAILLLCIGLVLMAELFNTAIEELCNGVHAINKEAYQYMGIPKDVAAGAVLVAAIFASLVGIFVFLP